MILINKANNPFVAAGFLLRGIKLLTNPQLRLLILVPILINIVLYGAGNPGTLPPLKKETL